MPDEQLPDPSSGATVDAVIDAVIPTGLPDLATLTSEGRKEWLGKGTPFVAPKEPEADPTKAASDTAPEKEAKTADSPTAKESAAPDPDEGKDETALDPASGSTQQGKQHPRKATAAQRVEELLEDRWKLSTERDELRKQLEALKKGDQKAESPAAAAPKEASGEPVEPGYEDPVEPDIEDFATLPEFNAARQQYAEAKKSARDKYRVEMVEYRTKLKEWLAAETKRTVEIEFTEKQIQLEHERDLARAIKERGGKEFLARREAVGKNSTEELQQAITAFGPGDWDLLVNHLGGDLDELKRIGDIFAVNRVRGLAELGALEYKLKNRASPPAAEKPPVESKHSKAPPPLTELAGRNGAPVDTERAFHEAGQEGDFRNWYDRTNAREIKQRA